MSASAPGRRSSGQKPSRKQEPSPDRSGPTVRTSDLPKRPLASYTGLSHATPVIRWARDDCLESPHGMGPVGSTYAEMKEAHKRWMAEVDAEVEDGNDPDLAPPSNCLAVGKLKHDGVKESQQRTVFATLATRSQSDVPYDVVFFATPMTDRWTLAKEVLLTSNTSFMPRVEVVDLRVITWGEGWVGGPVDHAGSADTWYEKVKWIFAGLLEQQQEEESWRLGYHFVPDAREPDLDDHDSRLW